MRLKNLTDEDRKLLREVGERIYEARTRFVPNYSARQLSFDLGFDKGDWVLQAESGAINNLSVVDIHHLARQLRVTPQFLLGRAKRPTTPRSLEDFEAIFSDRDVARTLHSVAMALQAARKAAPSPAGSTETSDSNINQEEGQSPAASD